MLENAGRPTSRVCLWVLIVLMEETLSPMDNGGIFVMRSIERLARYVSTALVGGRRASYWHEAGSSAV